MRPIHIYAPPRDATIVIVRPRTRDAAKKPTMEQEIEALAYKLASDLEKFMGWGKAKDEDVGHAFHGNQWTGGIPGTPKPTTAKGKAAFEKLHYLFTTQHAFTQEELISMCGIKDVPTFKAYLKYIETPKAAKYQPLKLAKTEAGYQVVQSATGEPAIHPDLLAEFGVVPKKDEDHGFAEATAKLKAEKEAIVKAAPAPAPTAAPAPVPPKAHPGSMGKAQADKIYAGTLLASQQQLEYKLGKAPNGPEGVAAIQKALLQFKEEKASQMAEWAMNVHGAAYAPKPQGVFKADLQLAADLLQSKTPEATKAAYLQWKTNTSLEKAGNFPAKTKPAVPSSSSQATPTVSMLGTPAKVKATAYTDLVPDDFKALSHEDLTKPKGFASGISKIKSFLVDAAPHGSQGNKVSVEHKLRARLADKPNFQALVKRLGLAKEGTGSLESKLVQTWAGSSGDGNPLSVSIQLAVRDQFGIPDGHVEKKALTALQSSAEDEVVIKGIQHLNMNIKELQHEEVPVARAALREFVQAQYDETQELLKAGGFEHVYLARGMKFQANHDPNNGPAQLKLQPASSFSTNYSTAKNFAGGGTVFLTKVPRQQVLSTYATGFGCTGEHEVVVLAHEKMRTFTVKAHEASGHLQAVEAVKSKLKAKT